MFKQFHLGLLICFIAFSNFASAQLTPDGILFQAVARDANGNAAATRNIYAKVSILKGSASGTVAYAESFKVVSSNDGIFTLVIGKGTRTAGATGLPAIDWDADYYFVNIKIAIEPTIPTPGWTPDAEYQDMGTSQLWSVPYALFASRSQIADSAMSISTIVPGSKGGTGINNDGKTITLAQNLNFKGVGDISITTTGASNISLPLTGLLANTQYVSDRFATDTVSLSNRINAINLSATNTTALKLNISDTASMLNPYLRKLDTASLSNRINIKLDSAQIPGIIAPYLVAVAGVKYADTAAMLLPYAIRSNTINAINTKVNIADTALMLSNRFARDTASLSSRIDFNALSIIDSATALNVRKVNIADTASMLLPYAIRSNTEASIDAEKLRATSAEDLKVNIADTTAMLSSFYNKTAADARLNLKNNVTDTASMLLPYAIRSNTEASINAEKTRAIAAENLRVKYTDTASMLSTYAIRANTEASIDTKVNTTDTAGMLLPYAIRSNTEASIDTKVNITDTTGMLLPYAIRSNTETSINAEKTRAIAAENLRVKYTDTATMLSTYAIRSNTETSINAEKTRAIAAENLKVNIADTAGMLLPYAIRSNTEASIDLKVNIADTASMLSSYYNKTGTDARLNLKTNNSDTSAMLLPYAIRSNTIASINAEKTRAIAAENLKVNSTDTAGMLLPYAIRSNTEASVDLKVNIADTASMLSSYYNKTGTDARLNLKTNITDTSAMLLPYAIRSNTVASINAEKTRAIAAENLKVNISDTTVMLSPYAIRSNTEASIDTKVNIADTVAMLSPYAIRSNTEASIDTKVNIADTAGMLLPYAIRSNTEASINAEKTRAIAAENLRVKYTDSASMLLPYAIRSNTEASINTKVNISDTVAMLSPYAIRSNTEASIDTKVNITDTVAMLSPYAIRSNTEASINAEKTRAIAAENLRVKYTDSASMLLPYAIRLNTEASINTKVNIADTALMLLPYAIRSNTIASLDLKAPLASPSLTGTPTAPTASAGNSSTQIATTAFVAATITNNSTPDATTTTKGKIQLSNDLGGTADAPTVNSVGGSSSSTIRTAEILANAATANNTPNTIVKRDGSGDFTAGTITANLVGTATNVTGIVTGVNGGTGINNIGKTITLGGNINTGAALTTTGTTGGGNAADITLKTTAATELILPTTGTLATLAGTEQLSNKTINGITPTTTANGFTLAGGTVSKTLTVNNNATVSGTNTGDQTISLTGDVTGTGTGTFSTTLTNSGVTAGSYGSATLVPTITVDAKGRVTNVANTTISGVSPVGSALASGKIIVGNALGVASVVDMSGDVTIDNVGVTTIGNDKITTSKIVNSNITYSKIQNVTTGKILGRTSVGNGIVEEIATTGTGDVVRAISPTFTGAPQVPTPIVSSNNQTVANTEFVTRAIGNISASSVSGVLPGSNGGTGIDNTGKTITLGGNFATSGANSLIFTTTGGTNVTVPTSGTLATVAQLDAIRGGTFSGGQITGIVAGANGGTGIDNTGKTITLGGNMLTGADFTTKGTLGDNSNAASVTLKTTAVTELTLPTSGTLATLNGTETFTNKTITAATNTISGLTNSNLSGTAGITDANLATISTTGKVANTATTATNVNTLNAIVARDGSGNFVAGTITAALAGNAATATKLASTQTIYGNSFDGSASLSQVIAPTYGGTGNAFTKFTGATSSEKTYTLPDANTTILTTDALVTPAQGGTGVAVAAANTIFAGPVSGIDAAPAFRALTGADLPAGSGLYIANSTTQQTNSNFNISGAGIIAGNLTAGSIIKKDGTSAQFLKADGSVDTRSFATLTGSESLTNKSVNGVTPTAVTTGFTLAGGLTNNKILTVASDANVAGTNTGDVALTGQDYLSISNQTITAAPVNLAGANATGILAAARFPALTGDITNSAGAVATTISANAVTNTKIADNAVTSTKVADNAISSAKIATSAVTLDKIASISVQKLLGNKSASAAGAPGEISIGTGLALDATTGVLSASGSGGTVTGTGTAGQLPYWSTASGLASNPNFTWDNTNKIAKIGEGVNHINVDAYTNSLMSSMPAFSVIGSLNSSTEQTLLRLKRGHNHGSSYAGQLDFVSTGGASNLMRVDLRLNNASNDNYYNFITLENQNGNLGINNIAPTEKLDVTGNIRFSGALKPNNLPGTAGQYLTSQGGSTAPTWTTFNGVTSIGSIASTATANGATITSGVLNLTPADATIGGVLTNGAQSIGGNKRFFGLVTLNDNLQVNFSGSAGAGIVFTGDGDMVDKNDGYGTMRFTNGIKINNGNGSAGTTTNITLTGSGNITAAGTIESAELKLTGGTPGLGKVLTSDANGLASWTTPSTGIGGSGTASYIPKFNAATTVLGNSNLYDDGTSLFVNSTTGSGGNKLVVNSGARLLPTSTAGATTQTGGAFTISNTSNDVMDMGAGVNNGWIQVTDKLNLASSYSLQLNPNGGNVGIGLTTAPTSKLHVNGDIAATTFNNLVVKANGTNVVLGTGNVLTSLTSGTNNVAVGQYALNFLDAGSENLGLGFKAMYNTRGSNNVALGHNTLWTNNTGNNNTAIGHTAGYANTGSNNTFLGYNANSSGSITNATAIGNGATVTVDNTIQLGNVSVVNVKTSGTITAGDVTYPKLHNSIANQVLSINASGVASWGNASAATLTGGTAGSMPYQSSTSITSFTAAGTSGQILSSTGTTAPAWISTLPIANGGTGSATQNFVDLTTAQTIAGSKTFSSDILMGSARIGLGGGTGGSGGRNIAMGISALAANTSGQWNVALGAYNLQASVTASNNVAVGNEVLGISAPGNDNTGVGNRALYYNTGANNTAIGSGTLNSNTSGAGNTALGASSGAIITTGTNNTFIGKDANANLLSRTNATALGFGAIVTSDNAIQLGNSAVTEVKTSGAFNAPVYSSTPIALTAGATITWTPLSGLNASVTLGANSTLAFGATPPVGSSGTLVVTQPASGGPYTLALPTAGTHKVLGSSLGINLSTAANAKDIVSFYYDGTNYYWNVGLGYGVAQSFSASSIAGGSAGKVLYQSATGTTAFTEVGTAGQILTSTGTTAPAWVATLPIANGGTGSATQNFIDLTAAQTIAGVKTFSSSIISNSVTIGKGAGQGSENIAVGATALGTGTGGRNTAVGVNAMSGFSGTGFNNNTSVGYANLSGLTTGYGNTSMGAEAMASVGTSGENTAIGNQTLRSATSSYNTVLGATAGNAITTGSGNTIIGRGADVSAGTLSNATAIGYGAVTSADNTMQLGNTSLANVKTSGTITAGAITYPNVAGTNGYVLTTNGSNTASWTAPSGVDLTTAQTIGGVKTFSAASTVVNNNLTVNAAGASGQGIILSDDGDIVDNNDGSATFRFTAGVKINNGNKTAGTTTAITLANNGNITTTGSLTAAGNIIAAGIKLTTGAANGYILTSSADGTASWAASSSTISGGTLNALPKYSSATAITPSAITDDGTTVSLASTRTLTGANAAVNEKTAAYQLVQGDNGKVITMNSASAITLTIPSGLTAGFNCMIIQYGAGTVTIAGSGVTIVNRSNYSKTGGQYAIVTIVSPVANTFITGGDMQ